MNIRAVCGKGEIVNINKLSTENVDKVNKSLDKPVQTVGENYAMQWNNHGSLSGGGYLMKNKSLLSTSPGKREIMRYSGTADKVIQRIYTEFCTGFPQVIHKLWKSGYGGSSGFESLYNNFLDRAGSGTYNSKAKLLIGNFREV